MSGMTTRPQPDILASAPRCGARTRAGAPCRSPAVHGRARCRMHGGARGSGAPHGNRNAWKHGGRSGRLRDIARYIRATGLILAQARLLAHSTTAYSNTLIPSRAEQSQSPYRRTDSALRYAASPGSAATQGERIVRNERDSSCLPAHPEEPLSLSKWCLEGHPPSIPAINPMHPEIGHGKVAPAPPSLPHSRSARRRSAPRWPRGTRQRDEAAPRAFCKARKSGTALDTCLGP